VKIFKKIVIGVVCVAALFTAVFWGFTLYARWRTPGRLLFCARDKNHFARGYALSKAPPPPGPFYEDEYYKFRVLKGSMFAKTPLGYGIKLPGSGDIYIKEFSSWAKYLEYNDSFIERNRETYAKYAKYVRKYPQLMPKPYSGTLAFEVLVPELYGEIVPEWQSTIPFQSGESGLDFLTADRGFFCRYVVLQRKSGHIVEMYLPFTNNPQDERNMSAAFDLLLSSLVLRKDLPDNNVTELEYSAFWDKFLYPKSLSSEEKSIWRALPE